MERRSEGRGGRRGGEVRGYKSREGRTGGAVREHRRAGREGEIGEGRRRGKVN